LLFNIPRTKLVLELVKRHLREKDLGKKEVQQ
jgi:hypothetical protein